MISKLLFELKVYYKTYFEKPYTLCEALLKSKSLDERFDVKYMIFRYRIFNMI